MEPISSIIEMSDISHQGMPTELYQIEKP